LKLHLILLLFLAFLLLITSCGTSDIQLIEPVQTDREEGEAMALQRVIESLPDSVELSFTPIQARILEEGRPKKRLELIQVVSLGSVGGENVSIQVYKESDESKTCGLQDETISFLNHKGHTYRIQECTSSNFTYEDAKKNIHYFILDQAYEYESRKQIFHAGLELAANGPNRILYLLYDVTESKWFSFEDWGIPYLQDLDKSGDIEIVNQFPGQHMSWPDVTIYRWHEGVFERSNLFKESLQIPIEYISAITYNQDEMVFEVTVMNQNLNQLAAVYRYEKGNFIRVGKRIIGED